MCVKPGNMSWEQESICKRLSNLQPRLINKYLIFICTTLVVGFPGCKQVHAWDLLSYVNGGSVRVPHRNGFQRSSAIHHEMECHFLHFIRRQLLKRRKRKGGILWGGKEKAEPSTIQASERRRRGGGGPIGTQGATVSEFKCEHNWWCHSPPQPHLES